MENLYIDTQTKEFKRIREITNLHEVQIVAAIFTRFQILEIKLDDQNDAGLTIEYILNEMGFNLNGFCIDTLNMYDEELAFLLGKTKFLNYLKDCPDCGCEVEVSEHHAHGHEWEDKDCTNPSCDYATCGEPDWDLANPKLMHR